MILTRGTFVIYDLLVHRWEGKGVIYTLTEYYHHIGRKDGPDKRGHDDDSCNGESARGCRVMWEERAGGERLRDKGLRWGRWPPQSGSDTGAVNTESWHKPRAWTVTISSALQWAQAGTWCRWVLIMSCLSFAHCVWAYLFMEFNPAQLKLSKGTVSKSVTTAAVWGSFHCCNGKEKY